jgi:hypothetical protein
LFDTRMNALLAMARSFVIFIGALGFIFGQLFFGSFSLSATLAGVSGILAGTLSGWIVRCPGLKHVVVACCTAGLVGVALLVAGGWGVYASVFGGA